MKLFDEVEAFKFPEENLIFITVRGFLYYIYTPERDSWRKYRNAGNDSLTVRNYPDVSREELIRAMHGIFPTKKTDFLRLCHLSQLYICDMLDLYSADYPDYMADYSIYKAVHRFLLDSDYYLRDKSYLKTKELFDNALTQHKEHGQIVAEIKELSFSVIGRDIFNTEIRIVDGHDGSSYFWIMPVRIVDDSDTDSRDCVAEMHSMEISIEENDVDQYLTPFLYRYFDEELDANKHRSDANGFEWYLTYNFFTFDSIRNILNDIRDTVDAITSGRVTEYTKKLKDNREFATEKLIFAEDLTQDQIETCNADRPKEHHTGAELIVDFYRRFLYRMEYMLKVGEENGYDLISFMGP